jgi:hypothetical protein
VINQLSKFFFFSLSLECFLKVESRRGLAQRSAHVLSARVNLRFAKQGHPAAATAAATDPAETTTTASHFLGQLDDG